MAKRKSFVLLKRGILCFITIILSIMCAACMLTTNNIDVDFGEGELQPSKWGELSNVSGTVDLIQFPPHELDSASILSRLSEINGLAERTDLVFHSFMENGYLQEEPGGFLSFDISHIQHDIRYRLMEVDQSLQMGKTVFEAEITESHFEFALPDRENALYFLALEARDDEKEVVDTAVYFIETVPPMINAELSLGQTVFRANSSTDITLQLKNFGPSTLYVGNDYSIEQYKDGRWYELSLSLSFNAKAFNIAPGEVHHWSFVVPAKLTSGKYRVVKGVQARSSSSQLAYSDPIYLAMEFEVVRDH